MPAKKVEVPMPLCWSGVSLPDAGLEVDDRIVVCVSFSVSTE